MHDYSPILNSEKISLMINNKDRLLKIRETGSMGLLQYNWTLYKDTLTTSTLRNLNTKYRAPNNFAFKPAFKSSAYKVTPRRFGFILLKVPFITSKQLYKIKKLYIILMNNLIEKIFKWYFQALYLILHNYFLIL